MTGSMHTGAAWVLAYAVNALWQAPLLAAAAWLMAHLLRWAGPRTAHRVWVAALLLQVVLPACVLSGMPALGGLLHRGAGNGGSVSATTGPATAVRAALLSGTWTPRLPRRVRSGRPVVRRALALARGTPSRTYQVRHAPGTATTSGCPVARLQPGFPSATRHPGGIPSHPRAHDHGLPPRAPRSTHRHGRRSHIARHARRPGPRGRPHPTPRLRQKPRLPSPCAAARLEPCSLVRAANAWLKVAKSSATPWPQPSPAAPRPTRSRSCAWPCCSSPAAARQPYPHAHRNLRCPHA